MSTVVVKNGNVDGALKVFKQKNAKDGLLKEVRKREHYSKPGVKRREAKKEAIKNSRRRERSYN
jgi:small subunit ribosomal protein S21